MKFTRMQQAINRALNGDMNARNLLNIDDQEVVPVAKTLTRQTLRADFKFASVQYLAAMQLQLRSLERLAKKYLVHLCWIDRHQFSPSALTEDATHVDEKEILEQMSVLCADLPLTRHPKDLSSSEEEEEEEEDAQLQSEVEDMHEEMEEDDSKTSPKRPRSVGNKKRKNPTPASEEKPSKVAKRSHHKKQYCHSAWLQVRGV